MSFHDFWRFDISSKKVTEKNLAYANLTVPFQIILLEQRFSALFSWIVTRACWLYIKFNKDRSQN